MSDRELAIIKEAARQLALSIADAGTHPKHRIIKDYSSQRARLDAWRDLDELARQAPDQPEA